MNTSQLVCFCQHIYPMLGWIHVDIYIFHMVMSRKMQNSYKNFQPSPGFELEPVAIHAHTLSNYAMETDCLSRIQNQ